MSKQMELIDAQLREWPASQILTIQDVYSWCDESPYVQTKLYRYQQIAMALQYTNVVWYHIEGTNYRGFRFGTEGSEYMSLYSGELQ